MAKAAAIAAERPKPTQKERLRLFGKRFVKSFRKYWMLYALFLPCAVFLIIFNYGPMYGVILAFKDLSPRLGIFYSPWTDPIFKHFQETFADPKFLQVTLNTLWISFLRILFGFPAPILLAVLFNEVRHNAFKRTVQTITYLPHFLSWVVLAGMIKLIFAGDGMINQLLMNTFGMESIPFLTDGNWFIFTLVFTNIWKTIGFSTIIYMAAIAGIEQEQYEAATIDGASRWQKIRYITIPGIAIAISINLILTLSSVLDAGFDQIFNLYSPVVYEQADIIDTYVYRMGVQAGQYGMSTALGLAKSLVAFLLIITTNKIITKCGGEGVW